MKRYSTLFIYILTTLLLNNPISGYSQTAEWMFETPSAGSPSPRSECAFVKAGNKFYFLGSRGKKAIDIYDPITKVWTTGAVVPIEIHHFQAVEYNGQIYVVAGFTGGYPTETPLTNIYIYDPASNTWITGPEIPVARRRGSTGVVVNNQKIYVIAGATNGHTSGQVTWFDEVDPITGTWTPLPDAPRVRDHFHAALVGNKLVLAGGRVSSYPNTFGITVPEVDIYDFSTGEWSTVPNNIPTPRAGAAVAVLGNEVLVIGGESMSQMNAHSETEALNVATGTWRVLDTLNQGRHGSQAIVYNNKIYLAGGSKTRGGNGSTELSSMEVYAGGTVINGIEDSRTDDFLISCFPNPFYDKITLAYDPKIKISKVYMYNSSGEIIKEILYEDRGSEILLDEFGELPSGLYYIMIKGDLGENKSIKVIKR